MLTITENYANEHYISFSTHKNPIKSKTKGIIFSRQDLDDMPVPVVLWVKSAKYLSNKVTVKLFDCPRGGGGGVAGFE